MHLIYIFAGVACSVVIAHLLRSLETRGMRTLHLVVVNYIVAILLLPFFIPDDAVWIPTGYPHFWWMGLVNGIIFIVNFVIYSKSTLANGVGVSVAAMRMSLVVPVVFSIAYYAEPFHLGHASALLMVLAALAMMILKPGIPIRESVRNGKMLLAMFLMTGSADVLIRIFEREAPAVYDPAHFILMIYLVALAAGLALLLWKRELRFTRREWVVGAAIGIPNLLSFWFMLKALDLTTATQTFALTHTGVVAGGTLLGRGYWKDPLAPRQWAGIGLALAAILLLISL